jgi:hypothetical protein
MTNIGRGFTHPPVHLLSIQQNAVSNSVQLRKL